MVFVVCTWLACKSRVMFACLSVGFIMIFIASSLYDGKEYLEINNLLLG